MFTFPAPLADTVMALRSGQDDLREYIDAMCDRIDAVDPEVQALLPEPGRRERLRQHAARLQARFPDPAHRPPLYGLLVGVKDIFHVDGFPTLAGTQLPPSLFAGPEAACVTALRQAGALILGKTVTTEFAYYEPGPTRNPHALDHTPGGSSSGSAAAVAAGLCPLALGTQTVGSVIRPSAFCGIVGFKPSYGRITTAGSVPFAISADHVGVMTQDAAGMRLAAAQLCREWQSPDQATHTAGKPVLGIPEGPYLDQADPETLNALATQVRLLEKAGYTVRHIHVFADIAAIAQRHQAMIAAEMAAVHQAWFDRYADQYRPRTAALIRQGQAISEGDLTTARAGRTALREALAELMAQAGIDLWICPAAIGTAPAGLEATGDPAMNLPWTHAGLPTVTLPAGPAADGLPLGLQCVASFMADERLLAWAVALERIL
jgi:Asp-tRNA(Asn)/Glu-tRNA(Gln) amidotransferase A subunit family amidase